MSSWLDSCQMLISMFFLSSLDVGNMSITRNVSTEGHFDEVVWENDTVRFHCEAEANPRDLRYL